MRPPIPFRVLFACAALLAAGCMQDRITGPDDTAEIPSSGGPSVRVTYPATPPDTAEWTMMVYMSGDNNLERYVVSDIEEELAALGSSSSVQVVVLADRGPGRDRSRGDWQTTKLFHVTRGMEATAGNAVIDWGECNMGEAQVLTDFVAWTRANYPARRYLLYFWGHGWSWHPGWVMEDETNNGALDMDEIEGTLDSLGFIDVVAYDACNMASIEVATLWHGHAWAITGSQEWVGWDGIESDNLLAQLHAEPSMGADQVAVAISRGTGTELTWSAIALDERFDTLLTAVDSWAAALLPALPLYRSQFQTALGATQSFEDAPMDKDLYDMAFEIHRLVPDTAVQARCNHVMNAVNAAVLHEHHDNTLPGAHGITVYHPETNWSGDPDNAYYLSLGFALETHWDEFLAAWHAAGFAKSRNTSYPQRRSLQEDGRAPPSVAP